MSLRPYPCKTVRNMLPLHVGGDLDPRHVPDVDRHLSGCLPCFREFRELAAMRGRLAVLARQPLPAGVLDGFAEEVMARVAVGEPGPAAQAPRPGPRLIVLPRLAAAAAMLLVTLAGWRVFSDAGALPGEARRPSDGNLASTAPEGLESAPAPRRLEVPGWRVPGTVPAGPAVGQVDPGTGAPTGADPTLIPSLLLPTDFEFQLRFQAGEQGRIHLLQTAPSETLEVVEDSSVQPRARRP